MNGRQIVFTAKGRAELREFEFKRPGPGEALVECAHSVVSAGTERANLMAMPNTAGGGKSGFPIYPGYSASGQVVELGEGVGDLAVGDWVIVSWCGHRSHFVKPAAELVRFDADAVDPREAAFAHIASFPMLGVRKLRLEMGESAMVAGLGLLGLFAVQFARLAGAFPTMAADFDPSRRELAEKLGADLTFSPGDADFPERVREACSKHAAVRRFGNNDGRDGVDGVVEVSGSAAALRQALEYVAWEGRISLLGCTRVSDAEIDFYKYIHRRGVSLIGSHAFTRPCRESRPGAWTKEDEYRLFLKLIAAGRIQVAPLISELASPEDAGEVYGRLAEAKNPPPGFVFDWRGKLS